MIHSSTSHNGYSSCIKIAGIPILPPLITDERRNELNEEKAKAVEIEKSIKRKRTSIDSGVMTGSYIDSFKNSEALAADNSVYDISISELKLNEHIHNNYKVSSENVSNDSFLKTALEDSEFREFFYSTAERIFKDNYMLSENRDSLPNSPISLNNHSPEEAVLRDERTNHKESLQITIHPSQQSNILEVSNNIVHAASSAAEIIELNTFGEAANTTNVTSAEIEEQPTLPPVQLVRRNSYTLDSPSPVLLEHLAKQTPSKEQKSKNWTELSAKKEEYKGLGFKSFLSTKKQRKTWSKKDDNHFPPNVDDFPGSKVPFSFQKKSKTFVKSEKDFDDSNYSLPVSSRSSPTHLPTFAYSSDCIQSDFTKSTTFKHDNFLLNLNNIYKPNKKVTEPVQQESSCTYENIIMTNAEKDRMRLEGSSKDLKETLSGNINSVITHPNYDTLVLYPSHDMLNSSNSHLHSSVDQSFIYKKKSDYGKLMESKNDPLNETDDTVSVCSSLSLSKFMPVDDNASRPSTAEDLSALFSELQLRHERQIAELLDMQRKEKVMLSQLHSNQGTISSQNTTNLSVSELSFDHNVPSPVGKRTPCRELFPPENNRSPPKEEKRTTNQHYNSDAEKVAALKLTACVRGYLTRRLLKTEKVQQLIDTIKESLNCAFSLQSETELRKNDLELHERLAHQLTAALYELQSIISAPVATRMSVIATDREKLRNPVSRPSSAISSATQKAILRRQKSMYSSEKKSQDVNIEIQGIRPRAKSLCLLGMSGTGPSGKSDSSPFSVNNSRKPWR